jgi:hypothetical protein
MTVFHRLARFYLLAAIVGCVSTVAPAKGQDLVAQYRAAVIAYFRANASATAVFSAGGQAVGAVYEVTQDGKQLHAIPSDCFPNLKPPATTPSSLPQVLSVDASAAAASLDSNFLSIFTGGSYKQVSSVEYTNVTSEQVSLKQLQSTLDEKACPELRPALVGAVLPPDQPVRKFYIIGTVLRAKENVLIGFTDEASAGAVLKGLQARIANANLGLSASIAISGANQKAISVASSEPVVVAVRPAVIAEETYTGDLGGNRAPPKLIETAWRDFEKEQRVKQASWLAKFYSGGIVPPN